MADPIGFYNSHYTGGEIDAAVGQIKNKLDKPSGLDTAYKIVTTNNSSTGTLGYTHESTGSTVMQRDANGRAQVVAGTTGKEIVNFEQLQAAIKTTYRHTISIRKNDDVSLIEGHVYLTIYSTNNLNITTLAKLQTVLGNTFVNAASGYMNDMPANTIITHITQDRIFGWGASGLYDTTYTGCTFTDTVTPI